MILVLLISVRENEIGLLWCFSFQDAKILKNIIVYYAPREISWLLRVCNLQREPEARVVNAEE